MCDLTPPSQFRVLRKDEIPSGATSGVAFTTVSLNPEIYLPWLKTELVGRGVTFVKKRVYSIGEAAEIAGPGGVVVNATALGARSLIGVQDADVYPIRGQTILAYAPSVQEFLSYPLGLGTFISVSFTCANTDHYRNSECAHRRSDLHDTAAFSSRACPHRRYIPGE